MSIYVHCFDESVKYIDKQSIGIKNVRFNFVPYGNNKLSDGSNGKKLGKINHGKQQKKDSK